MLSLLGQEVEPGDKKPGQIEQTDYGLSSVYGIALSCRRVFGKKCARETILISGYV
jgi:hypothetical protein